MQLFEGSKYKKCAAVAQNLYFIFSSMAVTNEPLELGHTHL